MGILELLHRLDKGNDERMDKWFLMGSPIPMLTVLALYFIFVLKVGPMLMKNRPAFRLKNILLVYNVFQIIYCAYMFVTAIRVNRIKETLLDPECKFERSPQEELEFLIGGWHYFMAKVIDLLDTIFFVLRKKNNQITFLHVYHHSAMVFFTWLIVKFAPGEQFSVVGLLNSLIHVLMYTYYLMAAMGPQYQKYLWWKKYMTRMQLLQFILIVLHMVVIYLKGCPMSKTSTLFCGIHTMFFMYLFFDFYRNAYNDQKKKNTTKTK